LGTALFREDALLLVAHGSVRFPHAGRVVQTHAATLRAEHVFAEVSVGLLNGEPGAAHTLARLRAPEVHVVPFFMEAGWFTNMAVPRALGLDGTITRRNGQTLRYTAPIGTHDGMAALIENKARRLAPDATTLLVVGHGSARTPGRVTALHGHVERMAESGRFARVAAAFLEEPPFAADMMRRLRGTSLAIVGFFAGEGGHVRNDLPQLIAAERTDRLDNNPPLVDCGMIADEPDIRRIILDQIIAAA
jgi:sirohydrochlorin cobaltochelatase